MNDLAKIGIGCTLLYFGIMAIIRNISVTLKSYAFKSVNLTNKTVSLTLNLLIRNPLLFGVTIYSVDGKISMQGREVGYVNTTYNYYLSGNAEHVLPVIVNLYIGDVGLAAMDNIASGDVRTLNIGFDGKVRIGKKGNMSVPVKVQLGYNDLV